MMLPDRQSASINRDYLFLSRYLGTDPFITNAVNRKILFLCSERRWTTSGRLEQS